MTELELKQDLVDILRKVTKRCQEYPSSTEYYLSTLDAYSMELNGILREEANRG